MGVRQLIVEVDSEDYKWLLKKAKKIKKWVDESNDIRGGNSLSLSTDAEYAEQDFSISIISIMDLTPEE